MLPINSISRSGYRLRIQLRDQLGLVPLAFAKKAIFVFFFAKTSKRIMRSYQEKGIEMMEFMAWLPIIGIFALIGFVRCLRALYAVFKWIRIWIDLKEWPNLEAFRKKYVKPEYQNGFSQADFREFFWSF